MRTYIQTTNPAKFQLIDIRTAIDHEDGQPWFSAQDVCRALDIPWLATGTTLAGFPANWSIYLDVETSTGVRQRSFINEPGLYRLITKAAENRQVTFCNWVADYLMPELRTYHSGLVESAMVKNQVLIAEQIDKLSFSLMKTSNAFRKVLLEDQLRRLCNLISQPLPPVEWQGINVVDQFVERA